MESDQLDQDRIFAPFDALFRRIRKEHVVRLIETNFKMFRRRKTMRAIAAFIFLFVASSVGAAPATYVFTINTEDAAGYAEWMRSNSEGLGSASGANELGLCIPKAGAEKTGDLYGYARYDSMSEALAVDFNSESFRAEIAKNTVPRVLSAMDVWSVVHPFPGQAQVGQKTTATAFFVKSDDLKNYVKAISAVESAYRSNGFEDFAMQVATPYTGDYTGKVFVMIAAPNGERLGAALDAMNERWAVGPVQKAQRMRTPVRGFAMDCEVAYVK